MSRWFEPPGGPARSVSDADIIIVSQDGVTRSITRGEFIRGVSTGLVFLDSGGSGKKCFIQPLFMGVNDAGEDVWTLQLSTVPVIF